MPTTMIPAIAIVGRPNVGKSTLFNALTHTRQALVADLPGLTRDRQYGILRAQERRVLLIDTGGVESTIPPSSKPKSAKRAEFSPPTSAGQGSHPSQLNHHIVDQTMHAVEEAELLILIVDAQDGRTAVDEALCHALRATGKPLILAVNKSEGVVAEAAMADFYLLGLEPMVAISAKRGSGLTSLVALALEMLLAQPQTSTADLSAAQSAGIRVAILGRPNAGKSTLVNQLVGETRVLADHSPGTTRDSIFVPFRRRDTDYTLIDTAGIRRRSRVDNAIEKFSVAKSLQALDICDVAVLVMDATEGVTEQDVHLLGLIMEAGRGLTVALNKWDRLADSEVSRVREEAHRRFVFADYIHWQGISALRGTGIGRLLQNVDVAWRASQVDMPTSKLTEILERALERNPPPLVRGRRIKMRYAHQGGTRPPRVIIHGNQTEAVPEHYRRYLSRCFRESWNLVGTPVEVEFKSGENPFRGKRNVLSRRQRRHRQRVIHHSKK